LDRARFEDDQVGVALVAAKLLHQRREAGSRAFEQLEEGAFVEKEQAGDALRGVVGLGAKIDLVELIRAENADGGAHVNQTMQGHCLTPSLDPVPSDHAVVGTRCAGKHCAGTCCDAAVTLVNTELALVSQPGSGLPCAQSCVSRATSCTSETVSG